MSFTYNKEYTKLAEALRKNMTKEEKHLWYDCLSFFPIKFYRQKQIGEYIVDFYCDKAKLVIEIDGSQHYEDGIEKNDIVSTIYLESLGLQVVRFTNLDIKNNFEAVCEDIANKVKLRLESFGLNSNIFD